MKSLPDKQTFERMFLQRKWMSVMLRLQRICKTKLLIPVASEKFRAKRMQSTVPTTGAGALAE